MNGLRGKRKKQLGGGLPGWKGASFTKKGGKRGGRKEKKLLIGLKKGEILVRLPSLGDKYWKRRGEWGVHFPSGVSAEKQPQSIKDVVKEKEKKKR